MTRRVEISPLAARDLEAIDLWWRENRLAAPDLFLEEFAASLELIAEMPLVGRRYRALPAPETRRVLMHATRYHVYYHVTGSSVLVVAVWSAVRGSGPDLCAR